MEGRKFRIHAQIYLLFWDVFLQCTIFKLTFQIFEVEEKHKITINSMFFIFTSAIKTTIV